MTVSIWQSNLPPLREVDFLIVGAGLVGCTAAYFAAQAGRQVVITDALDVALGASSRNAGFMISSVDVYYHHAIAKYGHDVTREIWHLAKRSQALWYEFINRAGGTVKFQRTGSLLLAESEAEAEDLAQAADAMLADDLNIIHHKTDPLKRGYFAAIEQPDDGAVQPFELVHAIRQQSGVSVIPNNELYHITQHDDKFVTAYTRMFIFKARQVLLCTNAYSPRLHPYFINKVVPTRAQCLVTEPLVAPVLNTCGYSDYGYMYYRMTFDNRLLIGGGRKQNIALENDTTEDRVTDPVQQVLDNYLKRHFPDVTVPVSRRWAGIMGFTPDSLPLVGVLPDMPDVGFAVGFTGHGLSLGAGAAERAVNMMLHGTHPGALDAKRLEPAV